LQCLPNLRFLENLLNLLFKASCSLQKRMSDETKTADATQPSEAVENAGGMDAIREAIKAQLEPVQEKVEEPTVEPTEEVEQLPPVEETVDVPDELKLKEDDPKWKQSMLHRYNKLTAQRKELEEQVRELKEKQYEAKKETTPEDKSINKLIDRAETLQDLERLEDDALDAERWAKRSLSRYRRDPEAVEKEIERKTGELPDDVEVWLEDLALNAEFSRESDIPKKKKSLIAQQQSFSVAANKYPWLNDPTSPARAWVDEVKQANPGIKALPDVDLYLARALVGFYIEQEQAAKTGAPKAPVKQPTRQPGRPTAAAIVDDREQKLSEVKKGVMKTGSRDGLKEFIKLHLEQK